MKKILFAFVIFATCVACSQTRNVYTAESDGTEEVKDESIDLTTRLRRVPGVKIIGNGANAQINIRGPHSFSGNYTPLFILDGVQFQSYADIYHQVVPDQIAKIEVLKSQDQLAQYGMRGAAGVIVITTKDL